MGQIGANATKVENNSIGGIRLRELSSKASSLQLRDVSAQCGPGVPCVDGSCCNSVSTLLSRLHCIRRILTLDDRKGNVDSHHTIA
jgi:hypothetical protein